MSVRHLKHLKTKKGRDETGLFILEGEKFIAEIPPHYQIDQYIIANRYANSHDIAPYQSRAICHIVKDSIFDSLADTVNPQGILAICYKQPSTMAQIFHNAPHFILLGENLNDPGNIGTLIRTAAAAGASGVVLTQASADVYNPKVLRATAGAIFRIPVVTDIVLADVHQQLSAQGVPIYAAHPRGENTPYALPLAESFCLLVGNEAQGITPQAMALANQLVTIPMVNRTESLNASVAGCILLYEAVRQRGQY